MGYDIQGKRLAQYYKTVIIIVLSYTRYKGVIGRTLQTLIIVILIYLKDGP